MTLQLIMSFHFFLTGMVKRALLIASGLKDYPVHDAVMCCTTMSVVVQKLVE